MVVSDDAGGLGRSGAHVQVVGRRRPKLSERDAESFKSERQRPITVGMARFDFEELVERLPLVVYVDKLDDKSSPLYISPQIATLMGYSQEEWLADPDLFTSSLHPDDRERVLADLADRNAGLTGRRTMFLDYRLIARDGRVVWIRDDEIVVARRGRPADRPPRATCRTSPIAGRTACGSSCWSASSRSPPTRRRPTRSSPTPPRASRRCSATSRSATSSGVTRTASTSATRRHPGQQEFGDAVEWSAELRRAPRQGGADRRRGRDHGSLARPDPRSAWSIGTSPRSWTCLCSATASCTASSGSTARGPARGASTRSRSSSTSPASSRSCSRTPRPASSGARAERDLRNRDAILGAISSSAERFLAQPNFDEAVVELMRELGQATGASGAFVFENVEREDGVLCAIRRAGWAERELADHDRRPEACAHTRRPRTSRAGPRCSGAATSSRATSAISPPTSASRSSSATGSRSLAVPIFVDGSWWGFIDFDDCEHERDWSAAEIDAIRAAAGLIAGCGEPGAGRAGDFIAATRSSKPSATRPSCSSRRPTGATVRTRCSSGSASPPA